MPKLQHAAEAGMSMMHIQQTRLREKPQGAVSGKPALTTLPGVGVRPGLLGTVVRHQTQTSQGVRTQAGAQAVCQSLPVLPNSLPAREQILLLGHQQHHLLGQKLYLLHRCG